MGDLFEKIAIDGLCDDYQIINNEMIYRNYKGTIEFSEYDGCYFGKVKNVSSLISYEAISVEKLKEEFEEAIDMYLKDCKERGIKPESPYNVMDENQAPNEETIAAIEEIKNNGNLLKDYKDVDEMIEKLLREEE